MVILDESKALDQGECWLMVKDYGCGLISSFLIKLNLIFMIILIVLAALILGKYKILAYAIPKTLKQYILFALFLLS